MAVGQLGAGAPPILVYFSGDWDVHWAYGVPYVCFFFHLLSWVLAVGFTMPNPEREMATQRSVLIHVLWMIFRRTLLVLF